MGKGRKMFNTKTIFVCAVCAITSLLWAGNSAFGSYVTGTAGVIHPSAGNYEGMYKYEFDINWDLKKGPSQLNVILPDCLETDGLDFRFDSPSGYSTDKKGTNPYAVSWQAERNNHDPSIKLFSEFIKYKPIGKKGKPDKTGSGQFWFYSNASPQWLDCEVWIAAKNGPAKDTVYGQVLPVPEPTTFCLISSGLLGLLGFKKNCRKK